MKKELLPGTKLFKVNEDDSITLIRVTKSLRDEVFLCKDTEGTKLIFDIETLNEKFIVIRPQACIQFIIGEGSGEKSNENIEDVLVMLYRRAEIDTKSKLPFGVCRQTITDFFATALNQDPSYQYIGMSLTANSIPEGVRMEDVLTCNKIIEQYAIAAYMDDNLNTMISFLGSKARKRLDAVIHNAHCNIDRYNKRIDDMIKRGEDNIPYKLLGCSRDLKSLLDDNNFMLDFLMGFGIYAVKLDIKSIYTSDGTSVPVTMLPSLSFLVTENIISGEILKYSHDIDFAYFDQYGVKNMIVSDLNNEIYVITYKTEGKYHIPVEAVESSENIDKLSSLIPNVMSSNGYDIMRFNKSKYE